MKSKWQKGEFSMAGQIIMRTLSVTAQIHFSLQKIIYFILYREREAKKKRNKLETKIFTFPKWFQRYITEKMLTKKVAEIFF